MRNWMLGLLALAALLMLGMLPLAAQDETESGSDGTIFGLTIVDGAIVRVGPDFAYREVGSLSRNASVVIIGRAGDFFTRWDGRQWLQIEYGGGSGWIYARLLRTSIPFNSIPPVGRMLPRDRNGRVPDEFDLSSDLCSQWQGDFTQSGDFMAGDSQIVVTYPTLQGATLYSVIVISPTGFRTAFDSETDSATILLNRLPNTPGTYTWRVAPYWANSSFRSSWQQICLLQTGGAFDKPETEFNRAGSR